MTEGFHDPRRERSAPPDAATQPAPSTDGRARAPDWSVVEQDYRCAGLSLRQMAVKHACHHSSIANRARRHGWTRDKQAFPAAGGVTPFPLTTGDAG